MGKRLSNHSGRAPKLREGYWFASKAGGLGATPVTWQGGVATLGIILLAMAIGLIAMDDLVRLALVTLLVVGSVALVLIKTDREFHWDREKP